MTPNFPEPTRTTAGGLLALALVAGLVGAGCQTGADGQGSTPLSVAGSGRFEDAMRGVTSVSLHPNARLVQPRPGQPRTRLQDETDSAIEGVLRDRGFSIVRAGASERWIAYAVGVEGEMSDSEMLRVFGISPGVDDGHEELRGGLILVVVDSRTRNVLWRGSVSGSVEDLQTGDPDFQERLQNAVRAVLDHDTSPATGD